MIRGSLLMTGMAWLCASGAVAGAERIDREAAACIKAIRAGNIVEAQHRLFDLRSLAVDFKYVRHNYQAVAGRLVRPDYPHTPESAITEVENGLARYHAGDRTGAAVMFDTARTLVVELHQKAPPGERVRDSLAGAKSRPAMASINLVSAAEEAYMAGKWDEAISYAETAITQGNRYRNTGGYTAASDAPLSEPGSYSFSFAVNDTTWNRAHTVIGLAWLARGDRRKAAAALKRSIAFHNAYGLGTVGPRMALAKALLPYDQAAVIRFLAACGKIEGPGPWNPRQAILWQRDIEDGRVPQFTRESLSPFL
jgi:hypothetical protein